MENIFPDYAACPLRVREITEGTFRGVAVFKYTLTPSMHQGELMLADAGIVRGEEQALNMPELMFATNFRIEGLGVGDYVTPALFPFKPFAEPPLSEKAVTDLLRDVRGKGVTDIERLVPLGTQLYNELTSIPVDDEYKPRDGDRAIDSQARRMRYSGSSDRWYYDLLPDRNWSSEALLAEEDEIVNRPTPRLSDLTVDQARVMQQKFRKNFPMHKLDEFRGEFPTNSPADDSPVPLIVVNSPTPGMVRDVLELIGIWISYTVINDWSGDDRDKVFQWASQQHLIASDNEFDESEILAKPEVLG